MVNFRCKSFEKFVRLCRDTIEKFNFTKYETGRVWSDVDPRFDVKTTR